MAPTVVAFSGLVLILSLISFASMATSEVCQYNVRIKTGNVKNAGTDSTISLTLQSSSGDKFTVKNIKAWGLMGPGHDYYERGNLDVFSGRNKCLSVCAITVTSNGERNKPGWYLDYVEITVIRPRGSNKVAFPVNQWLALSSRPYHLYAHVNLCSRRFNSPLNS